MSSPLLIIVLILVLVIGIPWYIKKKKQKQNTAAISSRHDKDEVWKTIKQYLKDTNDYGKEIVDSYVAKRNAVDYINPNDPKVTRKKTKFFNKIRQYQIAQSKTDAKKSHTNPTFTNPKVRDLYVVCFITKDVKSNKLDKPRAIECEIINTKINKKEWDRKIVINGSLNYDKEMEWIAPIRAAEELKTQKIDEQNAKKKEKETSRRKIRQKKQQEKIKRQQQKRREKASKKN